MDIVGKARKLERRIARSLDVAVQEFVGRTALSPLEIVHAVIDGAERQVQEAGRGRRVFPFNRVVVTVVAGPREHEKKARYAAVFDGPPSLAERLKEALAAAGCRPGELTVAIVHAPKPGSHWAAPEYHVELQRVAAEPAPPPAAPPQPPRLKVTVVAGKASHRTYEFAGTRIDIGRRADVLDARQRLVRTNHVAFAEEGPDVNRSVSRRHAHIAYAVESGAYRLSDDRSVHGTSIVRDGRTIPVPSGPRGVRLQSGDEILLGQARLKVAID
jgi:hypothetical protein